jgi:hypothetical protein
MEANNSSTSQNNVNNSDPEAQVGPGGPVEQDVGIVSAVALHFRKYSPAFLANRPGSQPSSVLDLDQPRATIARKVQLRR